MKNVGGCRGWRLRSFWVTGKATVTLIEKANIRAEIGLVLSGREIISITYDMKSMKGDIQIESDNVE